LGSGAGVDGAWVGWDVEATRISAGGIVEHEAEASVENRIARGRAVFTHLARAGKAT
jgi:hypothetical protein